jgi:hypothetical protein
MLPRPPDGRRPRPPRRRLSGELSTAEFLRGVLDTVRTQLADGLETRHQGSLIKLWRDEPAIHFEMAVHHSRGRVELALHFETRDARRNQRLLEYIADDLPFLKEALGVGLEAEPWDKGWTRLYLTRPVDRLGTEEQVRLAAAFAEFIDVLEPIRQEAVDHC